MRLVRWNGEKWWVDDRPVWRRILRWVAWFGGWEAHSPKLNGASKRPLRKRLRMLTPVSLFGHRITFYGWGWQVRRRGGWWVKSRNGVYWSPNGTPSEATIWFRGGERFYSLASSHKTSEDVRGRVVKSDEHGGSA